MADTKPAEQSATKTEAKPAAAQPQRQANSGQKTDPGAGVADQLKAGHTARTTVPGHEGIDARLDNRAGAARPPLEEWPAKPQQIDGPDVAHQAEHTRATLKDREEKVGTRKGMFSIGSHGLSTDEGLREGNPVKGPDEG